MRATLAALLLLFAPVARAAEGPAEAPAVPAAETSAPAPAPEPILLRDAVRRGLVEASGDRPVSYVRVTLRIESRSPDPISLDLAGSHLRNRTGTRCQRLGLGPPIEAGLSRTSGGRHLLDLAPRATAILNLQTVCLDAGIQAPTNQTFSVAPDALPEVRERVLRWWMDHPDAPQGAVNAAIWQYRDTVHIAPGVVRSYREPKGTFGALMGGTAYRLHDGELMAHDPGGVVRFIGTELFQALPTREALYAIGLGEDRKPELWRLVLTGDRPWNRVHRLRSEVRVKQVIPGGRDRIALVHDQGVTVVDTAGDRGFESISNTQIMDVTAARSGEDSLNVVVRVPGARGVVRGGQSEGKEQDTYELWTVDLRTGNGERLKRYWNVESVVAGVEGIYALTPVGRLRVLAGDDFKNLPATDVWSRLAAVGRNVLWVVGRDGLLAMANARNGATLRTTTVKVSDAALSIDPVTDDLAVISGDRFLRVRALDGVAEEVGGAPAEEE